MLHIGWGDIQIFKTWYLGAPTSYSLTSRAYAFLEWNICTKKLKPWATLAKALVVGTLSWNCFWSFCHLPAHPRIGYLSQPLETHFPMLRWCEQQGQKPCSSAVLFLLIYFFSNGNSARSVLQIETKCNCSDCKVSLQPEPHDSGLINPTDAIDFDTGEQMC